MERALTPVYEDLLVRLRAGRGLHAGLQVCRNRHQGEGSSPLARFHLVCYTCTPALSSHQTRTPNSRWCQFEASVRFNSLTCSCQAGELQVYDVDSADLVFELPRAHAGAIWSLAVQPRSTRVLSGSADKTVALWAPEDSNGAFVLNEGMLAAPRRPHLVPVTRRVRVQGAWSCLPTWLGGHSAPTVGGPRHASLTPRIASAHAWAVSKDTHILSLLCRVASSATRAGRRRTLSGFFSRRRPSCSRAARCFDPCAVCRQF